MFKGKKIWNKIILLFQNNTYFIIFIIIRLLNYMVIKFHLIMAF